MSISNSRRDNLEDSGHWVMLDPNRETPDQQALRKLSQKLDLALDELGHIDYQLSGTLAKLRSDIAFETHDNLNGQIAQLVEAGIRQAITNLANELNRAKALADEVVADKVSTEKSQ